SVATTVEDLQLRDLDDRALGVLDGTRHDGVRRGVGRALAARARQGGVRALPVHGERDVDNGRGLVQAGSGVVVADPDRRVALDLPVVVRAVSGVRVRAVGRRTTRQTTYVRDVRGDQ